LCLWLNTRTIHSVDGYRVTRNVPLPYTNLPSANAAADDDDDAEAKDLANSQTTKQRIADDFAPLANIHLLVLGRRDEAHKAAQRRRKARKERRGRKGGSGAGGDDDSSDGSGDAQEDVEDDLDLDDGVDGDGQSANKPPPGEQVISDDDSDVDHALADMADAHRMMGKASVGGGIGAALGREEQDKSKQA
jgi:hypothetical protein